MFEETPEILEMTALELEEESRVASFAGEPPYGGGRQGPPLLGC